MSPFNDPTLMTKLEIILNRDGTVDRIGVVKPSGFLAFDYGAYNSVMRAQPYPEAPTSILSGDGKVYVHWGFYRGGRQCGTFNAEPYILPHPPGTPGPGTGGLRDLESGGLVPDGAQPTWGTQPAREEGAPGGEGAPPEEPPPPGREDGEGGGGDDGAPPPRPEPRTPRRERAPGGSSDGVVG
jgi:TonB family protein